MSVPTQNMSCFTKNNLREPSRDCCKVSRSSREQKRCPMQQKIPATSKVILEKTNRRIFQNCFKLSLEIMCLFLPPELLWAQCGKSQFTRVLPASKRCGNGHKVDWQTRQSTSSQFLPWAVPRMFPQHTITFPCKINPAQERELRCSVDKAPSTLSSSCPCNFNLPYYIHSRYFSCYAEALIVQRSLQMTRHREGALRLEHLS